MHSANERSEAAYASKAPQYYVGARSDFVTRLPDCPTGAILEIGCGSGETGAIALKMKKCGRFVGVELMPGPAERAESVLTRVIVGDVETLAFDFEAGEFDALILSEVLEHLREPGLLLQRLAPFLKPGAVVLASSPNISNWRALRTLARGEFPADDQGVFDRTHLRWFTPSTYAALFESAGFQVRTVEPVVANRLYVRLANRLFRNRFEHLFMTQIAIEAVRPAR